MRFLARLIATGCFTGYVPVAPGTAGSLFAVVLYWAVPGSDSPFFLCAILFLFSVGVWSATKIEKASQIKDNQIIVIDEIVGMLLTLLICGKHIKWLAIAFIIFRLFDIVKLFPTKKLERLPGGWGVMLDDVVAGIYAALTLKGIMVLSTYL
jgi:phosphatidylglycerophosphatase A